MNLVDILHKLQGFSRKQRNTEMYEMGMDGELQRYIHACFNDSGQLMSCALSIDPEPVKMILRNQAGVED